MARPRKPSRSAAPAVAAPFEPAEKAAARGAFNEIGEHGWSQYGGYLANRESNAALVGRAKYTTFQNLMANVAIVATGLRYYLSLLTKPSWSFEPASDSPSAVAAAELVTSVLSEMRTPWRRVVRKAGMYRFIGFSTAVWTAKRRADGKIGLLDIASRPQWTIERFLEGPDGQLAGFGQRIPGKGIEVVLPRARTLYLVDDALTDSPDGMGLLRHIVAAAARLERLEQLEGWGYETDMRGIPLIHLPLGEWAAMIGKSKPGGGQYTAADVAAMRRPFEQFLTGHIKGPSNGLIVDSAPFRNTDGSGYTNVASHRIELARGDGTAQAPLRVACLGITHAIARVLGCEGLLIGEGSSGNRSTSAEKAALTQLGVEGTLAEMAEGVNRDQIAPVCDLNGIAEEDRPRAKTSSLQMRDIEQIGAFARDMATAGVTLDRGDECVDELFGEIGLTPPKARELMDPPVDIRTGKEPPAPEPDDDAPDEIPDEDKPVETPAKKRGRRAA